MKSWILAGAVAFSLCLTACSDPNAARREQLSSEIASIQGQISLANQEVVQERQKLAFLENRLLTKKAELSDFQQRAEAYFMNHKMALAAIALGIGGTAVAIDANNEFSDDAQAAAGIGAFIVGMWAIGNMDEVIAVGDALVQADARIKSLKAEINALNAQRGNQFLSVQTREKSLQGLNTRFSSLSSELQSLK